MKWLLKNIKNIGLITLFLALVTSITWVVNLNRDIIDLKKNQITKEDVRIIIQEEVKQLIVVIQAFK